MKKILICYFSGTGNTKKVVELVNQSLTERGAEVTLYNIDDGNFDYDLKDFDLLGIAHPIHAFNAPSNVLSFVKELRNRYKKDKEFKKLDKKFFIIKTSGEHLALNNISSYKIKSIMKKIGYHLNNEYHYCMPYNMIFRHTDAMAYKMWELVKELVPIDCQEILDGVKVKLKYIPFGRFLAWVFRIEHWGGRINGKRYKVSDECVKCQLCVKKCPVKNITLENGEFHFGKKCLMCMRCSFNCPKNAIKIGWFNGWKVNGPYNFNKPEKEEIDKHKRYCKNSYKKYFRENEEKIRKNKENNARITN